MTDIQTAELLQEAVDQERREANTRNVGTKRREAKESLMLIGLSEIDAKKVVMAIHGKNIANVSIRY